MAQHRNFLQENDALCELYADTLSEVSDNSDNKSLDSNSDVPTTRLCKELRSSAVVVTSDTETSTEEKENSKQCEISSNITRQKRKSLRHYES
jgi:hypothetical protein